LAGNGAQANAITFTGGTNTLTLEAGSAITGNVVAFSPADTLALGGSSNSSFDVSQIGTQYQNFGTLDKTGSSTWTLTGTSTFTGPTTVNGGTLSVAGNIASSSGVAVNSGATLNGTGTVPSVTVNAGGTLAPGLPAAVGTLAISGNLMMQSAAAYMVQVTPGAASLANVSGSATLGGATVAVNAAPGSYTLGTKYPILTTTGTVNGTFSGVSVVGGSFGPGIIPTLSYDAHDVFLTLTQASVSSLLPPGSPTNQQNVANAINAFINSGGVLPPGFQNLFNLSPAQVAQALSQLSGENNVGGQQAAFQLMNEFLLLMLNPCDADRGGYGRGGFGPSFGGPTSCLAPGQERELPPEIAHAYAAVMPIKAQPILYAPRWNVWAAAFGGTNRTSGDPNGVGSHDFTARTGAVAAGVDYKLTPDTLLGFALAGGGTSWGLAQGLGGGRTDAFQAGLYGSQQFGRWYLSGAAAFANYWASTSRSVILPAVDTLNASFNAQSWGGRAEAGYKFGWGAVGLAPYVAFQAQNFSTPNYSESSGSGSQQFALSFAARTGNVERSELGSWASTKFLVTPDAPVTVFGRAAWAHDWQNAPQAGATFLGLAPVASFIVSGAKPAADLAVMTVGAELRMASGWALMGKFDGEFGTGTQTYVGTARLRYVW
jgi:outer membrane autotransporter protein